MGDISIEKARKEFGDETVAVDDVDLEIADGEFVVFVGPSGCGKTTLLRLVAGLESLTSGEIRLGGEAISKQPASQRDIAMVFQNYALYPHMSVARNVGYPLKQRRVPKDQIVSRVKRIAESLEIGHLLERKPGQLSGGQRQRVALARAIVRDPQAFLMDEPLSNLDAKLRVETRSEIVALQRRLDTTTLYVTHDQVEAMTMGDRIAVMYDGVLQQYGPPLELFANPANTFVASFLGTPPMNLLRGQLDLADGNRRFVLDGGSTCELALPERCPLPPRLADGRELRLGIRPRGLVPTNGEGDDHDRVRVTGRVRRTEQHGDLSYATLELGSQELTVALDWLQVPATLDLEVAPDDLRWFDRDGLAVEVAA